MTSFFVSNVVLIAAIFVAIASTEVSNPVFSHMTVDTTVLSSATSIRSATVTGSLPKHNTEIDMRAGNVTINVTLCSEEFHPNMKSLWADPYRYELLMNSILARDVAGSATGTVSSAVNKASGWDAMKRKLLPPQAITLTAPNQLVMTIRRQHALAHLHYDIDRDEIIRVHLAPDLLVNCSVHLRAHPEITIEATSLSMYTSTLSSNKTTLNECEVRSCEHYVVLNLKGGMWASSISQVNTDTIKLIDAFFGWSGAWFKSSLDGKSHPFAIHHISRMNDTQLKLSFSEEMFNTTGLDSILDINVPYNLVTGYSQNRLAVNSPAIGHNVRSKNPIHIQAAVFDLVDGPTEWTEDEIQTGINERAFTIRARNGWMRVEAENLGGMAQELRDAIRTTRTCSGPNGLCDDLVFDALFKPERIRSVSDPAQRNYLDNQNDAHPQYLRIEFGKNPISSRYAIPDGTMETFRVALPASVTCANRPVTISKTLTIRDTPTVVSTRFVNHRLTNGRMSSVAALDDVTTVDVSQTNLAECDIINDAYTLQIEVQGDAFNMTEESAKAFNRKITDSRTKTADGIDDAFMDALFARAPAGLNPDLTGMDDSQLWGLRVPSFLTRLDSWQPSPFRKSNLLGVEYITPQRIRLNFAKIADFDIPSYVRQGSADLTHRPTPIINSLDYHAYLPAKVLRSRELHKATNKIVVYGGHASISGSFVSGTGNFSQDGSFGFNAHELDILNGNVNLTITLNWANWRFKNEGDQPWRFWSQARQQILDGMVSDTDVQFFNRTDIHDGNPCTVWDSTYGITPCKASARNDRDLRRDYGWNARKEEVIPIANIHRTHDTEMLLPDGSNSMQVYLESVPVTNFLIVEHNRPQSNLGVGDVAVQFEQVHVYLRADVLQCGGPIYAGSFRIWDDNHLSFVNPYENECDVIEVDPGFNYTHGIDGYTATRARKPTMMFILTGGIWSNKIATSYAQYFLELIPDSFKDFITIEDITRVNNTHVYITPTDDYFPNHPGTPLNARGQFGKFPISHWKAPTLGSGTSLLHQDVVFDFQFPLNVNGSATQVFFKGSQNAEELAPQSLYIAYGNIDNTNRPEMHIIYTRHMASQPYDRNMSYATSSRVLATHYNVEFYVNGVKRDSNAAFTENEINYGYTGKWDNSPEIRVTLTNGRFWPEASILYQNKFQESRYWLRSSIANVISPQDYGWPNRTMESAPPMARYGVIGDVVDQILPLGSNLTFQNWRTDARYVPTRYQHPIERVNETYVVMTLQPGANYYIDDGTSALTGIKDDVLTFTLQHAQPAVGILGAVCSNSAFRDIGFTIKDTPERFYVRQTMLDECDVTLNDPSDPADEHKVWSVPRKSLFLILEGARWSHYADFDDYVMSKILRGPQCTGTSGVCNGDATLDKTPTDLLGNHVESDGTISLNFRDSTNVLWRVFNITRLNERTLLLQHRPQNYPHGNYIFKNKKDTDGEGSYGYSIFKREDGKTPQFVLDGKTLLAKRKVWGAARGGSLKALTYTTENLVHTEDLSLSRVALEPRVSLSNPVFLNDKCAGLSETDCALDTDCYWNAVDVYCYHNSQNYLQFEATELRVTTSVSDSKDTLNYDPVVGSADFVQTGYYGGATTGVAADKYRTTPLIGELDVQAGGVVLTLALRHGIWVENINCTSIRDSMTARRGGTFDSQSPKYGWNRRIRELIRPASCRRVNDTILTVTLFRDHGYAIAGTMATDDVYENNGVTYPDNGDEIIDIKLDESQICSGRNPPVTSFHIRNQRTSLHIIAPDSECDVTGGPKWGTHGLTRVPANRRRFAADAQYFYPGGFTMEFRLVGDAWTPDMDGRVLQNEYVAGETTSTPWNSLKMTNRDAIQDLMNQLTFDDLTATRSATAATAATEDDMWARSLARLVRHKKQVRVMDNFTLYVDLFQAGDTAHMEWSMLNHPIRAGAELGADANVAARSTLYFPSALRPMLIPKACLRGGNNHKVGASASTVAPLLAPVSTKSDYLYLARKPDVIVNQQGVELNRTSGTTTLPAIKIAPATARVWVEDSSPTPKILTSYTLQEIVHLQGKLTNATTDPDGLVAPLFFVIDIEHGSFHHDASNTTAFAEALRNSFIANYDIGRRAERTCADKHEKTFCMNSDVSGGYCEWYHPTLTSGAWCRDRRFVRYAWNNQRDRILPAKGITITSKNTASANLGRLDRARLQIYPNNLYSTMLDETITVSLNNFTLCGDNAPVFAWKKSEDTQAKFTIADSLPVVTMVHNFGECSISGEGHRNYVGRTQNKANINKAVDLGASLEDWNHQAKRWLYPRLDIFPYNESITDFFYIDILVEGDQFQRDVSILATLNETLWASGMEHATDFDAEMRATQEMNEFGLVKYVRNSDAVWKWVTPRHIRLFPHFPGGNQTGFEMASAIVIPLKFMSRVFRAMDGGTRNVPAFGARTASAFNPWASTTTISASEGGAIFQRPTFSPSVNAEIARPDNANTLNNKLTQSTDYTPGSNARDSVWVYGTQICRLRGGAIEDDSCYKSHFLMINQTRITWKTTDRWGKTRSSEAIRKAGFNPNTPTVSSLSNALAYGLDEDDVYFGNSTITLSVIGGWFNVDHFVSVGRSTHLTEDNRRQAILDRLLGRNAETHGWNARVDCGSVNSKNCKYSPTLRYSRRYANKYSGPQISDITVGKYNDEVTIKLHGDFYYAISADEIIDLMFTPAEVCGNTIMAAPARTITNDPTNWRHSHSMLSYKVYTANVPLAVQNLKTEVDVEGGASHMYLKRTPAVKDPLLQIDECWIYNTASAYTPVATLVLRGDIWNDDNSRLSNTNGTNIPNSYNSPNEVRAGWPNTLKDHNTFRGIDVGKYMLPKTTNIQHQQYVQMFARYWNVTLRRDLDNTRIAYLYTQPISVLPTANGEFPFTTFTHDFDLNRDTRTTAAGGAANLDYVDLVTYDRNGAFSTASPLDNIRFPTDVFAGLSHQTCADVSGLDCTKAYSHRKDATTTDPFLSIARMRLYQTTAKLSARLHGSTKTLTNDVNSASDSNRIVMDEEEFRTMAGGKGGITLTITLANGTFVSTLTPLIKKKIMEAFNVTNTGARLGANKEYDAGLTGFQAVMWDIGATYGSTFSRGRNAPYYFNGSWTANGYTGRNDIWLGDKDTYGRVTTMYITLSAPANETMWNYAIGEDEMIDVNIPKEAVCGRELRPWSGYTNVGNILVKDRPTKVKQVWEDISSLNGECTVNGYAQPTKDTTLAGTHHAYKSLNGTGFGYGRVRFIIEEGDVWHPKLGEAPPTPCAALTSGGWPLLKDKVATAEHPTCALYRELAYFWTSDAFRLNPQVFIHRRSPRVVEFYAPRQEDANGQYVPHSGENTDRDNVLRLNPQLFIGYDLYDKPISAHSVAYSNNAATNVCGMTSADQAVCKTNQLKISWANVTVLVEPSNITEDQLNSGHAMLNFTLQNGGTWRWYSGHEYEREYNDGPLKYDNGYLIGNTHANPTTHSDRIQRNRNAARQFLRGLRGSSSWNSYIDWMLRHDDVWGSLPLYFTNVTSNFLSLRLPAPKHNLSTAFGGKYDFYDDKEQTWQVNAALKAKKVQQEESGRDFFYVSMHADRVCPELPPLEHDVTCAHHVVTGNCIHIYDTPATATIKEDITEQCGVTGSPVTGGRKITLTLQNDVWRDLSDFDAVITANLLNDGTKNGYNFFTGEFCTICPSDTTAVCANCLGLKGTVGGTDYFPITLLDVLRHKLDPKNVRQYGPSVPLTETPNAVAAVRYSVDAGRLTQAAASAYFAHWITKPQNNALSSHLSDETERGLASYIYTRNIQRTSDTIVITFPPTPQLYLVRDFEVTTFTIPYQFTKGYNNAVDITATPSTSGQTAAIHVPMARATFESADNTNRIFTCTEDQLSTGKLSKEPCSFVISVTGTSLVPAVGTIAKASMSQDTLLANMTSDRNATTEMYGYDARRNFFTALSTIEVLDAHRVRVTLGRDSGYMIYDDETLEVVLPPDWVCHHQFTPNPKASTADGWAVNYADLKLTLVIKNVNARVGITTTPTELDECTVSGGAFTVTMSVVGDIWNAAIEDPTKDSFKTIARAFGADTTPGYPTFSFYRYSQGWTEAEKRLARLGNNIEMIRRVDWRTLVLHFKYDPDYEIWEDVEYHPFTGIRWLGDTQTFDISTTEKGYKILRSDANAFVTWKHRQDGSTSKNKVIAERWAEINTLNGGESFRYVYFKDIIEPATIATTDVGLISTYPSSPKFGTPATKSLLVHATRVYFSGHINNQVLPAGLSGAFTHQLVDANPVSQMPTSFRQAAHPLSMQRSPVLPATYATDSQSLTGPYPTENDIVDGNYVLTVSVAYGKWYGTWDNDKIDMFRDAFTAPISTGNNEYHRFSHLRGNSSYDQYIPFTGSEPTLNDYEKRRIARDKQYKRSIMPRSSVSRSDEAITIMFQTAEEYAIMADEFWPVPSSASATNYIRFPAELFCGNKRSPGIIPLNEFRIVNSPVQVHVSDTLGQECEVVRGYHTVTLTMRGDMWAATVGDEVNNKKGWFPAGLTSTQQTELWTALQGLIGGTSSSSLRNALLYAKRNPRDGYQPGDASTKNGLSIGGNPRELILHLAPDATYVTNSLDYYAGMPCHTRHDTHSHRFKCTSAGVGLDVPTASPSCSWIYDPHVAYSSANTDGYRCVASSSLSVTVANSLVFYGSGIEKDAYCLSAADRALTSNGMPVYTTNNENQLLVSRNIYTASGSLWNTAVDPTNACVTTCPVGSWRLSCIVHRFDIEPITAVLEGSMFRQYNNAHFASQPASFAASKHYVHGYVTEEEIRNVTKTQSLTTRSLVVRMISGYFRKFSTGKDTRYTRMAVDSIRRTMEGHRKLNETSPTVLLDGYDALHRAGFAEVSDSDVYLTEEYGFPAPPTLINTARGVWRDYPTARRNKWFDSANVRLAECTPSAEGYEMLSGGNSSALCKVLNFTNIVMDDMFYINDDQYVSVAIPRSLTCGNGVFDSRWNLLDTGFVHAGRFAITNVPTQLALQTTITSEESLILGGQTITIDVRGDCWKCDMSTNTTLYNAFVADSVLGATSSGGARDFILNTSAFVGNWGTANDYGLNKRDPIKHWPLLIQDNCTRMVLMTSPESAVILARGGINASALYEVPEGGFDGRNSLFAPKSVFCVANKGKYVNDNILNVPLVIPRVAATIVGRTTFYETEITNHKVRVNITVRMTRGTWAYDVATNKVVRDKLIQGLRAVNSNLTQLPHGWAAHQSRFEQMVESQSLDMSTHPMLPDAHELMFYSGVWLVNETDIVISIACNPFYAIHMDEEIILDIPKEALNAHHGLTDIRGQQNERIRIIDVATRVRLLTNYTAFGNNKVYKDILTECHMVRGMQSISLVLEGDIFNPNWRSEEFYKTVKAMFKFESVVANTTNPDGWNHFVDTILHPSSLFVDDYGRSTYLYPAGLKAREQALGSWGLPATPNVLVLKLQASKYQTVYDEIVRNIELDPSLLSEGYKVNMGNASLPVYVLQNATRVDYVPISTSAPCTWNCPAPATVNYTQAPRDYPAPVIHVQQWINHYYESPFDTYYDKFLTRDLIIHTAKINITGSFVELSLKRPSICERDVRRGGKVMTITVHNDWFRPEIGSGKKNCLTDLFLQGFLSNITNKVSYWNERMYRGKSQGNGIVDAKGPLQQEYLSGEIYRQGFDKADVRPFDDVWRHSELDNVVYVRLNEDYQYDITEMETVTLTVAKNLLGCTLCAVEATPKMDIWPDESIRIMNFAATEKVFANDTAQFQAHIVTPCQRIRPEIGTDYDRNRTWEFVLGFQSSNHKASSYNLLPDGSATPKNANAVTSCGTDGACLRALYNAECASPNVECRGFNSVWPLVEAPRSKCDATPGTKTTCAWSHVLENIQGIDKPNNTVVLRFHGASNFVIHEDEHLYLRLSNNTLLRSDVAYAFSDSLMIKDTPPELTMAVEIRAGSDIVVNRTHLDTHAISYPHCSSSDVTLCNTRLLFNVKYDTFLPTVSTNTTEVYEGLAVRGSPNSGVWNTYRAAQKGNMTISRARLGSGEKAPVTDDFNISVVLPVDRWFLETQPEPLTAEFSDDVLKGQKALSNVITILPPQNIVTQTLLINGQAAAAPTLSEDVLNGWKIGRHDLFCNQAPTELGQLGYPRPDVRTLEIRFEVLAGLNIKFASDVSSATRLAEFRQLALVRAASGRVQPNGFAQRMDKIVKAIRRVDDRTIIVEISQDDMYATDSDETILFIMPNTFTDFGKIGYPVNRFKIADSAPRVYFSGTMVAPMNWNTINYMRYGKGFTNITLGLQGDIWVTENMDYDKLITGLPYAAAQMFDIVAVNRRTIQLTAKQFLAYQLASSASVKVTAATPYITDVANHNENTFTLSSDYSNSVPSFTDSVQTVDIYEDQVYETNYATDAVAGAVNLETASAPWGATNNQQATMNYLVSVNGQTTSNYYAVNTVNRSTGVLTLQSAKNFNTMSSFQTYVYLQDNGEQFGPNAAVNIGNPQKSCRHILNVRILPVNDAPMFTVHDLSMPFSESQQRVAGFVANRTNGGADEASQTITYTVEPLDSVAIWNNAFSEAPHVDVATGDFIFKARAFFSEIPVRITARDNGLCTAPHVCVYSQDFNFTFKPVFRVYTNYSSLNDTFTDCDGIEVYAQYPESSASDPWKFTYSSDNSALDNVLELQRFYIAQGQKGRVGDKSITLLISQAVTAHLKSATITITVSNSVQSYTGSVHIKPRTEGAEPLSVRIVGFELGGGVTTNPYLMNPTIEQPLRAIPIYKGCGTVDVRWSCMVHTQNNRSCDEDVIRAQRELTATSDFILRQRSFFIPADFLSPGEIYIFRINANTTLKTATYEVAVKGYLMPVSASIAGGILRYSWVGAALSLDASPSNDYADPTGSTCAKSTYNPKCTYTWEACVAGPRDANGYPTCETRLADVAAAPAALKAIPSTMIFSLGPFDSPAEGTYLTENATRTFAFFLTVRRDAFGAVRTATVVSEVVFTSLPVPTVEVAVDSAYVAGSDLYHSVGRRLRIKGTFDGVQNPNGYLISEANKEEYYYPTPPNLGGVSPAKWTLSWSVSPTPLSGPYATAPKNEMYIGGDKDIFLTIHGDALSAAQPFYIIELIATRDGESPQVVRARVRVEMNVAPDVSQSALSLTYTKDNATAPVALPAGSTIESLVGSVLICMSPLATDTTPPASTEVYRFTFTNALDGIEMPITDAQTRVAAFQAIDTSAGRTCMQVSTPFTSETTTLTFTAYVADVMMAQSKVVSHSINLIKPSIAKQKERLDRLYDEVTPDLGQIFEAAGIISVLGQTVQNETQGQQDLFKKQIEFFAKNLANVTIPSRNIEDMQQVTLSTMKIAQNASWVSPAAAGNISLAVARIAATMATGQRGADRTVVLSSLQTFSLLITSDAHKVPQTTPAKRAELESNMRDTVQNLRQALMYRMVTGETIVIPGPDDASSWHASATPDIVISLTSTSAVNLESQKYSVGPSSNVAGRLSFFAPSGTRSSFERVRRVLGYTAAPAAHRRTATALSAVSAAYPGCAVGTTSYGIATSPYLTATNAQGVQVLSKVYENTLSCRTSDTAQMQSISLSGLSGRVEILGPQYDLNTMCGEFLSTKNEWNYTSVPLRKYSLTPPTTICTYSVLPNTLAVLHNTYTTPTSVPTPRFEKDDYLQWWKIMLVTLACFAFIYIIVAIIARYAPEDSEPDAEGVPMVENDNADGDNNGAPSNDSANENENAPLF
eukprot:PhM_4_TR14642/c0_g1_i1/m.62160